MVYFKFQQVIFYRRSNLKFRNSVCNCKYSSNMDAKIFYNSMFDTFSRHTVWHSMANMRYSYIKFNNIISES